MLLLLSRVLKVSVPLKQVHAFDGSLGVSCSKVVMFGVQDTRGGNLRGEFKRVIIIVPVDPTDPWLVVQGGFNKLTLGMVYLCDWKLLFH